ncbi:hypothetical protein ABW20_dc0103647 [Dactylellina cionopaga]|nr:hypothetical protein ABW20_dc0103647 [Dactylellina cionopaga]
MRVSAISFALFCLVATGIATPLTDGKHRDGVAIDRREDAAAKPTKTPEQEEADRFEEWNKLGPSWKRSPDNYYGEPQGQAASNDNYGKPAASPANSYSPKDSYNSAPAAKNCIQEWFGTAPLCDGACPSGWTEIRTNAKADSCEKTSYTKVIQSCEMLSDNSCWKGVKALCEKCY